MASTGIYSTAFVRTHSLTSGHSDTVNCLAFSPDGCYLASGGDDNSLIVWNVADGNLLYRLLFKSPVDCILWHPNVSETLVIGCQSGNLLQLRNFSLTNSYHHEIRLGVRSPIHCLDYAKVTRCLAIGMGQEVHITYEQDENHYSGDVKLPNPPTPEHLTADVDQRLRAVTVQFSKDGEDLIASYLAHGIICWNVDSRSQLWNIIPPSASPHIGHSAISPNGHHIVVHNLVDGLYLYTLGSYRKQTPRRSYKFEAAPLTKHRLQVAYLHQGQAVVCGTTTGNVCVWEIATSEYFQLLAHNDDVIQAVSTCQRGNFSYIATASAGRGQDSYLKIWRAKTSRVRRDDDLGDAVVDAIHVVTLTSNRLFHPLGKVRGGTLVIVVIMMCIAWGLYATSSIIPWASLLRATAHLLSNIWSLSVAFARSSMIVGWRTFHAVSNMLEDFRDSLEELIRFRMRQFLHIPDGDEHWIQAA